MKKNKRKISKVLVIIFAFYIIYFAYTFIQQQGLIYSKNTRIREIEGEIKKEQALQLELDEQKAILESDEYIEEVARERLGMVKQGEKIFIDANK